MSFTPNIPASGQSLGSSRTQVLNNFAVLRSTIAENHIDVNATGAGKHKFVVMPRQTVAPTTAALEGALYTVDQSGGRTEVYYRGESNDTAIQLTGRFSIAANPGYTFLPGGLAMIWGNTASGGVLTNVSYGITLTAPAYSVVITGIKTITNPSEDSWIVSGSISTTGFQIRNNQGATYNSFNWLVIGPFA